MDCQSIPFESINCRCAEIDEIIGLRHDVLIVGTNRSTPEFEGDFDSTTYHFGAFFESKTLCCLSMMRNDLTDQPAYQLRGMATHPECRGKGIGQTLLSYAENFVCNETGIGYYWCNARAGIEDFYIKQGWEAVSEPFMIEGVCMHVRLEKRYSS